MLQSFKTSNVTKIFPALQRVPDEKRAVYIDSGCTKSVFCNDSNLINVRTSAQRFRIVGVGGELPVTKIGDFPLALHSSDGSTHTAVIEGCLVAPDAFTSLLAATDVSKAGLEFNVPAEGEFAATTPPQAQQEHSQLSSAITNFGGGWRCR